MQICLNEIQANVYFRKKKKERERERENRGKCISEKHHPFSKYRVVVLQLHERPESTVAL